MTRKKKIPDSKPVQAEIGAFPELENPFQPTGFAQPDAPILPDGLYQPEAPTQQEIPGQIQSPIQPQEPTPPAVQLIFDKAVAEKWLASSWLRLRNVYLSLRFEPAGMHPRQASFCLYLAVRSLKSQGVIYVPYSLAGSPHLEGLIPGEPTAAYAVFTRP